MSTEQALVFSVTNCEGKIGHQYLEITLEGFFLKKKIKILQECA